MIWKKCLKKRFPSQYYQIVKSAKALSIWKEPLFFLLVLLIEDCYEYFKHLKPDQRDEQDQIGDRAKRERRGIVGKRVARLRLVKNFSHRHHRR